MICRYCGKEIGLEAICPKCQRTNSTQLSRCTSLKGVTCFPERSGTTTNSSNNGSVDENGLLTGGASSKGIPIEAVRKPIVTVAVFSLYLVLVAIGVILIKLSIVSGKENSQSIASDTDVKNVSAITSMPESLQIVKPTSDVSECDNFDNSGTLSDNNDLSPQIELFLFVKAEAKSKRTVYTNRIRKIISANNNVACSDRNSVNNTYVSSKENDIFTRVRLHFYTMLEEKKKMVQALFSNYYE